MDSVWDVLHTAIRPAGGALIAVASIGDAQPGMQLAAAIAGAALASSSHLAKAGTRAMANTTPEPFSNWALSLSEDGLVIALSLLALTHPLAAALAVVAGLALIVIFAGWLVRRIRRRLHRA